MPRYLTDVTLTVDVECLGPEDIELTVAAELDVLPPVFLRSIEFGDYTEVEA